MPLKPHPTDPDKMVYVSRQYNLPDSELLAEAVRILGEAQRAIGKILIERQRGMGYFHAEVDWLVNEQDNITKLIRAIKTREKNT